MDTKQTYNLRKYSSVEATDVEWLWYPYVPYGKVTIVQGDPGEGKSMFMVHLASLITKGSPMPDGSGGGEPYNVIYQAAEDGLADTVRPRLEKAGADCNRVLFLDLGDELLSLDDSRIEKAITAADAKLLVIDPMQAFFYSKSDSENAGRPRAVMSRIAKVAERTKCAVVLVGHLNKKSGSSKGIYRGLGSIDLAAVARSILLIGRDPDDPQIRVMAQIKNSLAPEGNGYVFELDPVIGFRWVGESEYAAEDILSPSVKAEETKKEKVKKHLFKILAEEDMASTEIMQYFKERGIGRRTVQMARAEMDIVSHKRGNTWYWHLENEE